eukprot:TRINITY_DN31156_c0_g1_i1.p1 TRINITY_DN31156_c0_g1~~TRINITY_DN31156_c0_g1_i1.p1  ORF type:complete len:782 (+),score=155.88 TRINITY_DN31156_c0_g1_i1:190-2535(+)
MKEGKRARRDGDLKTTKPSTSDSEDDDAFGRAAGDRCRGWRWPADLHNFFIRAYHQLESTGQNPSPRRIMDIMEQIGAPMKGLTLRQVQSHHQKYQKRLQAVRDGVGRQTNKGPDPMPVYLGGMEPMASRSLDSIAASSPSMPHESALVPFAFLDDVGRFAPMLGPSGSPPPAVKALPSADTFVSPRPVNSPAKSPSKAQSPRSQLRSRLTQKLGLAPVVGALSTSEPARPWSAPSVNLRGAGMLSAKAVRALSVSQPAVRDGFDQILTEPMHSVSMPEYELPRQSYSRVPRTLGLPPVPENPVSEPCYPVLRRSARTAASADLAAPPAVPASAAHDHGLPFFPGSTPASASATPRSFVAHATPHGWSAVAASAVSAVVSASATPRSCANMNGSGDVPSFGSYTSEISEHLTTDSNVGSVRSSASRMQTSGSSLSSVRTSAGDKRPVQAPPVRQTAERPQAREQLTDSSPESYASISSSQERRRKRDREVSLSDESIYADVKLLDLPNMFGMTLRSGTRISSGSSGSSVGDSSSSSRSLDSPDSLGLSRPILSDSITEVTSMVSSAQSIGSSGERKCVADSEMLSSSTGVRRSSRVSASWTPSSFVTRSAERARASKGLSRASSDFGAASTEPMRESGRKTRASSDFGPEPTRESGRKSVYASMSDLHVSQLRISTEVDEEESAQPRTRSWRGRRNSLRVSLGVLHGSPSTGSSPMLISPDSMLISPNGLARQTRNSGSRAPLAGVTPPSSVVPLTASNNALFDSVLHEESIISFQDTDDF